MINIISLFLRKYNRKMSKKADNYLLSKIEVGQVKKGFHELPA